MYFLAYPLANLILVLYNLLGQSTIAAIAALTLLLNLLTLPLTLMQQRSASKMKELQPELDKLRKKYGNDQERMAQEQMKLYREKGANPMSGCLPLLVQLPIWFGLLGAIKYCIPQTPLELFQFSQNIYNWIPGVIGLVPLQSTFLGMDLGQPPNISQWWTYALPLIVGLTSYLQQKLVSTTSPTQPSDSDGLSQTEIMTKQMQVMMPLMFMMFTINYAVGLSIYFIISSLIRIAQYYIFNLIQEREAKEKTG